MAVKCIIKTSNSIPGVISKKLGPRLRGGHRIILSIRPLPSAALDMGCIIVAPTRSYNISSVLECGGLVLDTEL